MRTLYFLAVYWLMALSTGATSWAASGIVNGTISSLTSQVTSDPADTGVVRLGNGESICWEASPASTDQCLTVTSGEALTYNGPVEVLGNILVDNASTANSVIFREDNSTNYRALKAPASLSADKTYLLPNTGTDGEELVSLSSTSTLTNKTLDAGTATTTHAANANFLQVLRHATDCTTVTDGKAGEFCYEQDANTTYICDPDSGDCSGTEWKPIYNPSGTTIRKHVDMLAAGCNNATSAPAWDLPTSGAAGTGCLGTTTTSGVLTFADGATTSASNHIDLSSDWVSTNGVDVRLVYSGDSSSTNNIRWSVATSCVADDTTLAVSSYNTASASNVAGPTTTPQRKSVTYTGVNITGCAAGSTLYLQVQRIGADGGDTYTGVAWLLAAELTLREAA